MKQRYTQGFTLIEIMVVVAIIGILAAIAYPAYTESVFKGRRAQGRTALAELLQQQERYLTQRNCYLGFTTAPNGAATPSAPSPATACGGILAAAVPFKAFSADSIANSAYTLSADSCPSGAGGTLSIAECVRVIATPISPDPLANQLRMTSTGTRDCTGTASATNPKLCWP